MDFITYINAIFQFILMYYICSIIFGIIALYWFYRMFFNDSWSNESIQTIESISVSPGSKLTLSSNGRRQVITNSNFRGKVEVKSNRDGTVVNTNNHAFKMVGRDMRIDKNNYFDDNIHFFNFLFRLSKFC